jgi:hypothetical protein
MHNYFDIRFGEVKQANRLRVGGTERGKNWMSANELKDCGGREEKGMVEWRRKERRILRETFEKEWGLCLYRVTKASI